MPVGRRAANLPSEVRAWSRSKSGGGVDGRSTPPSGSLTPTASPAKSTPLSESCSPTWCLACPGESTATRIRSGLDRDLLAVGEHVEALGGRGVEPAVERVEQRAVDPGGRVDQPGRVGQVPGALLVHVDGGRGKGPGHVADAAGVVEVDVGDRHARPAPPGPTPIWLERGQQDRDRGLAAGLDQHRRRALDQVAGRDPLPAAEQRVDLEHAVGRCDGASARRGSASPLSGSWTCRPASAWR